jgi:HEAT repeat protein
MCCLIQRLRCSRLPLVGNWPAIILVTVLAATWAPLANAAEIDWIMYLDPALPRPAISVRFSEGLVPLWIQALERPERDLRRRAAATIVRAKERGVSGLEATVEPLMRILREPDQDRVIQLTIVQALVALDARQAAPLLSEMLTDQDLDMAELIEPALARWTHAPMRDIWLRRLSGDVTLARMHILAIRGLVTLGESQALPRLLELAQGRRIPGNVRVAAAEALGKMQSSGLEKPAEDLLHDKSAAAIVDRLVAAKMLESHRGPAAESLLAALATDPQPAVQAVALGHLYRIDPRLITPLLDQIINSPDTNVRRWAADALIAQPSPEHVARLAPMLDDTDPDLRRHICDALIGLAKDASLHEAVIAQGRQVLAAEGWRGQEQAILLLVMLDDKAIVDRLLVLLDAERAEVLTTAAWGLSRLQVAATAAPMCAVFEKKTDLWAQGKVQPDGTYLQLCHLAQALGRLRHRAADPTLRKYIPKSSPYHPHTRAAAVWTLGCLFAGEPDDELAKQLLDRAMDDSMQIPEDLDVRRMAAVSLGRMKATQTLDSLRDLRKKKDLQTALGYAAAWAIREMTGEEIPAVPPYDMWDESWFLTPNDGRKQ